MTHPPAGSPAGAPFTVLAVQPVPPSLAERIARHGGVAAAARLDADPARLTGCGAADAAPLASADPDPLGAASAAVDAAALVVGALIAEGATTRASALDLLAADALATLAFEWASATPDALPAFAADAMRRFAALAGQADPAS